MAAVVLVNSHNFYTAKIPNKKSNLIISKC